MISRSINPRTIAEKEVADLEFPPALNEEEASVTHTGFSGRRNLCLKLPSTLIIVYPGKPVADFLLVHHDRSLDPFAVKRTLNF